MRSLTTAKRKQDQSPTIPNLFHLASPKENKSSSSEGVMSAKSETRPTLKTAAIDGWVKGWVNGWSLVNPLSLEAGYRPDTEPYNTVLTGFYHLQFNAIFQLYKSSYLY